VSDLPPNRKRKEFPYYYWTSSVSAAAAAAAHPVLIITFSCGPCTKKISIMSTQWSMDERQEKGIDKRKSFETGKKRKDFSFVNGTY